MVDKKYRDLINREIDGINTPEESEKLKEYLATNQEAQHLFNDLLAMTNVLNEVQEIEPPSDLKMNIMNAIQAKQHKTIKERNYLKSLLSRLQFKFNYRYAYAFSFGLILGILLYSFFNVASRGTAIDISKLYGTISLRDGLENFGKGDHIDIQLKEIRGTVDILYSESIVIADIALTTQSEIEIVLEFDEKDLNINGFLQANDVRGKIDMNATHLKLTHIDDNKYIIVFHDKTQTVTPLNMKILSSGNVVYTQFVSSGRSID